MGSKYKPYVVTEDKILETFGDVNFLEYGGQLLLQGPVYEEQDPSENQWLEVIEPPPDDMSEDDPNARWEIYRFEPEQFKVVDVADDIDPREFCRYLVTAIYDEDWPHPVHMYDEWFHKNLSSVAESMDFDFEDLRAGFCSDDVKVRCWSWLALGGYFGWNELDQYPLLLTKAEAYARYGEPLEEEDE